MSKQCKPRLHYRNSHESNGNTLLRMQRVFKA